MPSLRALSAPQARASGPITVEGATLPCLRAAGFEARVNAYVVGRTERLIRRAAAAPTSGDPRARPASPSSPSSPSSLTHWPTSATDTQTLAMAPTVSPGCASGTTDLWYLSLVAPRGQGTTLRALWANLVSNRERSVWLEGIGSVALGHHRLDLVDLGYPIHWNYRQAVIPPSRDVHSVLEADALTCYDPLLAPTTSGRRQRASQHASQRGAQQRASPTVPDKERGAMTLSSRSDAAGGGGSDSALEATARAARPLFVLLARPAGAMGSLGPLDHRGGADAMHAALQWNAEQEEQEVGTAHHTAPDAASAWEPHWLARLHLRFLATRIAWLPYYPRWADYLWQRALEQGEAEPLFTWSYASPGVSPAASLSSAPTALTSAYLCHPDPLALTADLQRAIRSGVFA